MWSFMSFLVNFWLGLGNPRHIATISQHLWAFPRQIRFWSILKKSWDWVRPPPPSLGQNPNFYQKFVLEASLSILSGPRGGTICTTSMGKNCSYLKYKNWKWCVYPALLLQTITDASRRRKYSPQHLVLGYTILTQHNKPLGGKLQHWLCSGLLLKALPLSPKGSLL